MWLVVEEKLINLELVQSMYVQVDGRGSYRIVAVFGWNNSTVLKEYINKEKAYEDLSKLINKMAVLSL